MTYQAFTVPGSKAIVRPLASSIYTLFWMNDSGGIDAASLPFGAINDAEAHEHAIALARGDSTNLWNGMRFVASLNQDTLVAV